MAAQEPTPLKAETEMILSKAAQEMTRFTVKEAMTKSAEAKETIT